MHTVRNHCEEIGLKNKLVGNQDGGIGRHIAPPRTTKRRKQFKIKKQPELTENRTAWKSDNLGDEDKTFVQTGRWGGDGQPQRMQVVAMWLDPETGGLWNQWG